MYARNRLTFDEFKAITKEGLDSGTLKVSKPLSDLDMAVQFACGLIGEERGYPCEIMENEVVNRILTFADADIFKRSDGWFYETELGIEVDG